MEEIKSAFERAWERAERLKVEEDKLKELKYEPEGAKLAAQFLKGDVDLAEALNGYESEVKSYVQKGAEAVLLSNITLPRTERHKLETKKALEGLRIIKRDRSRLAQISERMEGLFAIYERERQSLYENVRMEFEMALRQALQQQGIEVRARLQVERQPEFQSRWREVSAKLDLSYEEKLKVLKADVERLP